jgi:hypothetical protein
MTLAKREAALTVLDIGLWSPLLSLIQETKDSVMFQCLWVTYRRITSLTKGVCYHLGNTILRHSVALCRSGLRYTLKSVLLVSFYTHIKCDVFGVTRHKHVFTVTDTKLVAETVFTKELGKVVSVVTGM